MTFDEVFVAMLLALQEVQDRCKLQRVYHLEVFQNLGSKARFPCLVYNMVDSSPEQELSGTSGLFHSTWEVTIVSESSDDLREIATEAKGFNEEDYNDELHDTYPFIEWVSVDSDGEANEFAIEQQEKGMKTASLAVTMAHWGS